MPLRLTLNGEPTDLDVPPSPTIQSLLAERGLKADRVAVEHNGEIVPRAAWAATALAAGDRLEIVHFVGGGATS